MGINVDKMKQDRANRQSGGEIWDAPEGDNQIYVAAPPREVDVPYIETKMHYGLGFGKVKNAMAFCLEPATNPLLNNTDFLEQLEALGKDLSGGCEVCERLDAGEAVCQDPDQSGKAQSRWLWIISPIAHRSDPRQPFRANAQEEVKGLLSGYRVWDALCDLFGQAGDITDMDKATLARLIRTGTKINTKWEVQPDVETLRKPMKLKPTLRELIASATAPGEAYDPLRILAGMAKGREDVAKLFVRAASKGEYEETNTEGSPEGEQPEKPAGKFAPPGAAKGKSQAQVPAGGSKPAATASKPAPKTESKPNGKSTAAANANAKLKQLIAERGPAPSCYQVDPDPEAEICIKCPWNVECFTHCGVPLPEAPADADAGSEESESAASDELTVEQCEKDKQYVVGDETLTFTGAAKGKFYFKAEDGSPRKFEPGTAVQLAADAEPESTPDDDAKMKELEAELAARKGKPAAKGATAKK